MQTKPTPTILERDSSLELIVQTESGAIPLDIPKYRLAIEVLQASDLQNSYMKFPPRLTPKITEALTIARKAYRDHYNRTKTVRITSEILKLNRKLSHYAQGEDWAEEMNVAAILNMCRYHPFLNTRKFFLNNLKWPIFSPESVNMVTLFVMVTPDMGAIFRNKEEDISLWQIRVMNFLEELGKAPVPCRMIFLAMEIDVLHMIKRDLKKKNPKAWKHLRYLSKKDQLWYYGKIVQIIGTLSHDQNVSDILDEYKQVSMKIFKLIGVNDIELVQ
jgi:hypothetical protein